MSAVAGPGLLDFACVGDNCIDRYLSPVDYSLVGGNAVNVAVQLRRLGHPTAYFGAVGEDPAGRRTIRELARNGVDIGCLRFQSGPTAYTDIQVRENGDRSIVFEEFGACRGYRPNGADRERLFTASHVHIGWFDDAGALRRELAAAGRSVSQDVSVNAAPEHLTVDGLDIAFASAGENIDLARTLLHGLVDAGARLAVVTCGALGSVAGDGTNWAEAAACATGTVDTTGAGDTFVAGFLSARHAGSCLQDCLAAGHQAAAATCRHLGGFPQQSQPL